MKKKSDTNLIGTSCVSNEIELTLARETNSQILLFL